MSVKHVFSGTGQWMHKLFKPDPDFNYFGFNFYPDKASKKAFLKAGCQAHLRKDKETGEEFVILRRTPQKLSMKGELIQFGPPKIEDTNGTALTRVPGNGSEVEVHVTVYPAGPKGLGTRLDKVVVKRFVEYDGQAAA